MNVANKHLEMEQSSGAARALDELIDSVVQKVLSCDRVGVENVALLREIAQLEARLEKLSSNSANDKKELISLASYTTQLLTKIQELTAKIASGLDYHAQLIKTNYEVWSSIP